MKPETPEHRKRGNLIRAYVENVGREPRDLPSDDPLRWQWEYRGTPEELEKLRRDLFGEPLPPPEQTSLL